MRDRASAQLSGVAALGASALVFRVFALEAIDLPAARPAQWLSAALGAALALPAALPLMRRGRENASPLKGEGWNRRAACLMIFALSLYDAAVSARLFSVLATHAALPDHQARTLCLSLLAAATPACLMGAGAMSAAGVVWRRVALALGAAVLLAQAGELTPGWLFPLLGGGPEAVARGAERAAGHMALTALNVSLLGEGDRDAGRKALRSLGLAAALCVGAVLAYDMAVPAMPGMPSGRLFQLEMLAGCGQNGFAAETIYVLMMAGGMLLVGFEILAACAALCAALPRLPYWGAAVACGGLALVLCVSQVSGEAVSAGVGPWLYPVSLVAAGLAALPARRGEAKA